MEPTLKSNLYQLGFGISVGFAAMATGAWLSWPSSVIPMFREGSQGVYMTSSEIATMVSLLDLGNVLGPVPTSYLMDSLGRKYTLMISGAIYTAASILILIYTEPWLIMIIRLLVGMAEGIMYSTVPIYLGEIANAKIRGGLSTMFIGFLNIGMLYDYVIGPHATFFHLNIANLLIPLMLLSTITFYPESPYFLIMKGKKNMARKSLAKFRQVNATGNRQNQLDEELNEITELVENNIKNKGRFIDLMRIPTNKRASLIIIMLSVFERSSGISPTIVYSTITMPKTGGGLPLSAYMMLFSILLVVANYIALPLVDTIGRKPLLILSAVSSALVTGTAGIFYYFDRKTEVDVSQYQWIPYVCLILFPITYSIGIGFIPCTLVGELFPTNVKSYAGSVMSIVLAFVSFAVNQIFLIVSETFGVHVMYAFFTFSSISCAIFVQIFVFETKGKTLKEIQDCLAQLDGNSKNVISPDVH